MAATCGEVAAEIAGLPRAGEAGVGLWTSKPLRAGVPGEGGSCVAYVTTTSLTTPSVLASPAPP